MKNPINLLIINVLAVFLLTNCVDNSPLKEKVNVNEVERKRKHTFVENDSIFPHEYLKNGAYTDVTFDNVSFTKIPKSAQNLKDLTQIRFINQTQLPNCISNFLNLESIAFSHCRASKLPKDLIFCKGLRNIAIGETRIEIIPNLCGLEKLETLSIESSWIKNLPNNMSCLNLKWITLSDLRLDSIPESFFEIRDLEYITISGNKAKNINKTKLKKSFPNAKIYYEE
jgi:Leucine-rich repeat (LRR) protein